MTSANMHAHHVYNSLVILIEACTRLIYCSIFNAAVCECFHRSHSLWGLQTHPTLHSTWVVLRVHSHMRSMKSKACMASVLSGQLYPWENMILWSRRNCFREGGQLGVGVVLHGWLHSHLLTLRQDAEAAWTLTCRTNQSSTQTLCSPMNRGCCCVTLFSLLKLCA